MAFVPYTQPHKATFKRRYKRFLVDVLLEGDDDVTVVHTSNTGGMTGLLNDGCDALLSYHDVKTRKLKYGLEALHVGTSWVGVNTHLANKIAKAVLQDGDLDDLAGYPDVKPEKKVDVDGHTSRIDFFLSGHDSEPDAYVEVKSVTLREGKHALFPDAVSERGRKHLLALTTLKKQGHRTGMLYLVQRSDCERFAPAFNVDPAYAQALQDAVDAGVEVWALACDIDETGVTTTTLLPVDLDEAALA